MKTQKTPKKGLLKSKTLKSTTKAPKTLKRPFLELIQGFMSDPANDFSPREQKVVEMRFGLVNGIIHTLEEVAKEFDVTRERIRQIEARALEKLQTAGLINKMEKLIDTPYGVIPASKLPKKNLSTIL